MRSSERLALFALGCLAAGGAWADDAAQWLQRMNEAIATRNYDGTFSHWHGGQVEMLRIIHRVQDGTVSERLASLDGSGREFIRTGGQMACYLPDRHTVLVEQRPEHETLFTFPAVSEETARYYDIREVRRERFNRRDTHLISVTPKDEYRYGYRLWIDDKTAMPLKSELCDAQGRVIEQIVFANLTLSSHIADAAFRPEVSTEGFQWVRDVPVPSKAPPPGGATWTAVQLPPGFRMTVRTAQTLPGSSGPVDHLVFTDGLASVSVFVEIQQGPPATPPGVGEAATVGSSSAFSTVVDGHKVTAVGEVPPSTLQFIATQVKAEGGAAAVAGVRGH
jgi:sigma-E factor negative regulatory protein RseB